jgi:hypothetical protein
MEIPLNSIQLPPSVQEEHLNSLVGSLDRGNALPRPEIRIYSTGGPEHGTLLGTLRMYLPAFTPAHKGLVTANPIEPCRAALASGVAELFAAIAMDGSVRFYGSVGKRPDPDPRTGLQAASPYVLTLENNVIVAGGVIQIDSFQLGIPW